MIECQISINLLFFRCTIVLYIDLDFSACKIIEFTLKSLKEMLKALGLSQLVTKTEPQKLGEMVPDFLQKSINHHYSLEALTSPNATKAFTTKNFL